MAAAASSRRPATGVVGPFASYTGAASPRRPAAGVVGPFASYTATASSRHPVAAGVVGPFASYTAAAFPARPAAALFPHRSASPTRLHLRPAVRFAVDRRPAAVSSSTPSSSPSPSTRGQPKRTCMCSPTTHPGSFRCSLHKGAVFGVNGGGGAVSSRLNARRSAMTNSLVRIGTVEGEWVKRALAALIRPSSHQQKRRAAFRPRPSRLSVMSKAGD